MVFISGWTNPLTIYTKQFDYFRDKAKCIYIDLPGHGLSDAPEGIEYTQGLMADAIYAYEKFLQKGRYYISTMNQLL